MIHRVFIATVQVLLSVSVSAWQINTGQTVLGNITQQSCKGLTTYPTDFTRDIVPKPLHSHNDYWRDVPFYTGLKAGFISTESDVWLYNGELYVGHEPSALTKNRTFRSLYVNPILSVLERQNPVTPFVNESRNGVFDTDSFQTLYLWIDIKTDGNTTWPVVHKQLDALRKKNYLTYYDGEIVVPGPVTVIGTGSSPYDLMMSNKTYRDYFIDAPLEKLGTPNEPKDKHGKPLYDSTTSPLASTDFKANVGMVIGSVTDAHLKTIRAQIKAAAAKGMKVRYWNTPSFPIRRRNMVWQALSNEGVGLINVDDIEAAAYTEW